MTPPSVSFFRGYIHKFLFSIPYITLHTYIWPHTLQSEVQKKTSPSSNTFSSRELLSVNWVLTQDLLRGPTKKDTLKNNVNIRFPSPNVYFMKDTEQRWVYSDGEDKWAALEDPSLMKLGQRIQPQGGSSYEQRWVKSCFLGVGVKHQG